MKITLNKMPWVLGVMFAVIGVQTATAKPLATREDIGLVSGSRYRGYSPPSEKLTTQRVWQPEVGTKWQIVLLRPIKITGKTLVPDVKIWDFDLFDNNASTISYLHKNSKKVICYFSAGSYEPWRRDASQFKKSDLGASLDGWAAERWLNIRSANVRNIMKQRIAYAAQKGCDALDPDNINGFLNTNGINLTKADAVDYVKFLSKTAKSYGIGIGLKNTAEIIADVLPWVRFAVVESCTRYAECALYQPFINAKKPVFEIEYPTWSKNQVSTDQVNRICPGSTNAAGNKGFSVVIKQRLLDGWAQYCGQSKPFYTSVN